MTMTQFDETNVFVHILNAIFFLPGCCGARYDMADGTWYVAGEFWTRGWVLSGPPGEDCMGNR